MARTGRFGRSPRSAPSLTNTLVAIAREFQNQRAENIMDAWREGGVFEGKKATDELVLKFWKDKAAGVSKDDPLFDTYSNAATQLDYTINESKMTAKYAQGQVSDAAMVSFYMKWSKKVPRNSEFFRALQRDAGQYMRNQRANSEAARRKAEEERYQKQQAGTQKQKEAAGEYTIDILRRLAQSGYADGGIAPAIGAPGSGSDLTDFDPNDPNVMLRLIAAISPQETQPMLLPNGMVNERPTGEFKGNPDVLFHDDDGKPVTGTDIMKKLSELDPNFKPGTPLNVDYVTTILDRQMQGLNERIKRAKDTGHMTDAVNLGKSKEYVALLNREVAAYPVQKAYQELRADYDEVIRDPSSSPAAVMKAWQTYSGSLTKLAADPRIATDDNLRARLVAEVNGEAGVPTLNESFTGLATSGYDPASAKDAAENKAGIEYMQQQIDAVAASTGLDPRDPNKVVWTYGEKDSNGVFVPQAGGRQVGAATIAQTQAGGQNTNVVTVADPRGGAPMQIAVTAVPVYATATDPTTGEPMAAQNGNPIAWAYDLPHGSGTQTQYGFMTKEGMVFSKVPPWADGLKTTNSAKGGNHIEVDLTPVVEQQMGLTKDPLTGAYTNLPDLSKGKPSKFGDTGFALDKATSGKGLQLTYNPQEAAWATDTRVGLGSTDPMTDFKSLTLSTLVGDTEGHAILTNLDKNPAFAAQLNDDNMRYAGAQRDPKSGAWLPETADQAKLQNVQMQTNIANNADSFVSFIKDAATLFTKTVSGNPFKTTTPTTGITGPGTTQDGFAKLATDLVKGTPFEALGRYFQPGTNAPAKHPGKEADDRFSIAPVSAIKVPTVVTTTGSKTTTGPTAGPTATYTPPAPTQTGSQAPSQQPKPGSPQWQRML